MARRLAWLLGRGYAGRRDHQLLSQERVSGTPVSAKQRVAEDLRLVERFTRVGPNTLNHEFTVEDPTTYTDSWTAMIPLKRSEDAIYEYACHEGNYGMEGILGGHRAEEKAAEAATGSR